MGKSLTSRLPYPLRVLSIGLISPGSHDTPLSSARSARKVVNNERLEFLGDAILDAIVTDILYKRFENKEVSHEHAFTHRAAETLNKLAMNLGLISSSSPPRLTWPTTPYIR